MNVGREADESLSILRGDQCHAQLYRLFIRCPRSRLEREGAVADLPGLLPDCKAQRKSPDQIIGVCARLVVSNSFATPRTVAQQAPLSMELSRQEYWSGLPFPTPGDLADPGMELPSLVSPALAGSCFTTAPPGKRRPQVQPLRTGSPLLLPGPGSLHPLGSLRGRPGAEASWLNKWLSVH